MVLIDRKSNLESPYYSPPSFHCSRHARFWIYWSWKAICSVKRGRLGRVKTCCRRWGAKPLKLCVRHFQRWTCPANIIWTVVFRVRDNCYGVFCKFQLLSLKSWFCSFSKLFSMNNKQMTTRQLSGVDRRKIHRCLWSTWKKM